MSRRFWRCCRSSTAARAGTGRAKALRRRPRRTPRLIRKCLNLDECVKDKFLGDGGLRQAFVRLRPPPRLTWTPDQVPAFLLRWRRLSAPSGCGSASLSLPNRSSSQARPLSTLMCLLKERLTSFTVIRSGEPASSGMPSRRLSWRCPRAACWRLSRACRTSRTFRAKPSACPAACSP